MRSFEKRKLKYQKLNKTVKPIKKRNYDHKERVKENKEICLKYGLSDYERRKAYTRWKIALKKGHNVVFEQFLENKRVQIKKPKPKKYFYAKQFLMRALATPKWVNIEEIANFYMNCPDGYEVDHIEPIIGENSCGLHVLWNLQYLKKNKHLNKTKKHNKKLRKAKTNN